MNKILKDYIERTDVVVVGGGTAGVIAALQAAREGAETTIIEKNGKLGGTITAGSVPAPAYFYSRNRQIIKGIGWELIEKNKELDSIPLPDFMTPNPLRPSYHVHLNPHIYALIAEEECHKCNVKIHYHEIATDIDEHNGKWILTTTGKNVRRIIHAKEVIDCSGDADIVGMLGLERRIGETRQPGTLMFKFSGYDINSLDKIQIENEYQQALKDGKIKKCDYCFKERPFFDFLRARGFNLQHILNASSATSAELSEADIQAHQSLLRLLRFIRTLPGCANSIIEAMPDATSIRETWRIVGEKTITHNDYLKGIKYDDAIAYTLYFIDIHHENGIHHEFLADGVIPTIPLGALIPKGSSRITAAGRCISSDQPALSALRVEASCMAMGQAVGAVAALAVKNGIPSREVPIEMLRTTLKRHDAIVPGIDVF